MKVKFFIYLYFCLPLLSLPSHNKIKRNFRYKITYIKIEEEEVLKKKTNKMFTPYEEITITWFKKLLNNFLKKCEIILLIKKE